VSALIEGYVVVTLEFRKEGQRWLGHCRELSTATDAETFDAVVEELVDLVTLHLNELEDVGERQRFFAEHGIELVRDEPKEVQRTLPVSFDDEWLVVARAMPVEIPPTDPVAV
jgi:hypothetical protein